MSDRASFLQFPLLCLTGVGNSGMGCNLPLATSCLGGGESSEWRSKGGGSCVLSVSLDLSSVDLGLEEAGWAQRFLACQGFLSPGGLEASFAAPRKSLTPTARHGTQPGKELGCG